MTRLTTPLSDRRPRADIVGDLARQELAVVRGGEELAAFYRDRAAQDRHARPGRYLVAFPRGVIRLVQILLADHSPGPRIEQYDIGIGADRERTLARIETHDFGRVR